MGHLDDAFERAGSFELGHMKFEEADLEMLVIDSDNLEEHIAKQSAAVAYYGALYKEAVRAYNDTKKAWELRQKQIYVETQNKFFKDAKKKPTINDIECKTATEFSDEIEKWSEKISNSKKQADQLEVFWEGWKQKSFTLNNFVNVSLTERMQKESVDESGDNIVKREKRQRAIDALRQHKED